MLLIFFSSGTTFCIGQHLSNTTADSTYNIESSPDSEDLSFEEHDPEDDDDQGYRVIDYAYLASLASSQDELDDWLSELRAVTNSNDSPEAIKEWYAYKKARYGNRKIGSYACTLSRNLYMYKVWHGEEMEGPSTTVKCNPDTEQECYK